MTVTRKPDHRADHREEHEGNR